MKKRRAVAVINESLRADVLAKRRCCLASIVKLNRRARNARDRPWTTVVGVVADARTESLAEASGPQVLSELVSDGIRKIWRYSVRGQLDAAAIPVRVARASAIR